MKTAIRFLISLAATAGCGPHVVGPGRSGVGPNNPATFPPTMSMGTSAAPSQSPSSLPVATGVSDPGTLPQVAADSVLDLPVAGETSNYHEVTRGESLSQIGQRYGFSAEQLQRANGLEPNSLLQPGQLIYIPPH